jgi:hypothetical protein
VYCYYYAHLDGYAKGLRGNAGRAWGGHRFCGLDRKCG